jgi:hypothetical protein
VLRHIAGLVVLALITLLVIRVAFTLFGLVLALLVTAVTLAAAGYLSYTIVLMLSPGTAATMRRLITRTRER